MASAWTTIPDSDVDPESPITTSLMQALRDNPEGIAGAASGAPTIMAAALEGNPTLHLNITPVGNVGAGEYNLMSYTMPANTLGADGDRIVVRAAFTTDLGKNVQVKFYFGGTLVTPVWSGGDPGAGTRLFFEERILRTSSNNQLHQGLRRLYQSSLGSSGSNARLTKTDSSSIIIKFTGENLTDAVDDAVIQDYMEILYLPA